MADPRPQTEEDVFAICYYNYAKNRKSDDDLVDLLKHNILPDIIDKPKKFRMKKILPMLHYTRAYLSLEYIIQKFKPNVTYWHKFIHSKECKNVKDKWCCNGKYVCPDRMKIYSFLDIYTKHCVIHGYKSLTEIFSPYYNNPELHSFSWQLHTGKLIKYCTLSYQDRMDPDIIALINLTRDRDEFMQSRRGIWIWSFPEDYYLRYTYYPRNICLDLGY